jgi:hypothetical protein
MEDGNHTTQGTRIYSAYAEAIRSQDLGSLVQE